MIATDLPLRLREALDQQLAECEVLVRLEQPDPDSYKRDVSSGARKIGLVVAGLAGVGLVWAIVDGPTPGANNPYVDVIVALGFLLSGIVMLYSHLLFQSAARRRVYAITDRRVVAAFLDWWGNTTVRSIDPMSLRPRAISYSDGTTRGDIHLIEGKRFHPESLEEDFFNWIALRDVRATEAALNRLVQSSSKSSL